MPLILSLKDTSLMWIELFGIRHVLIGGGLLYRNVSVRINADEIDSKVLG